MIACVCDKARLGWSPGGGGAAGLDRSGGEDEATTWRRQRGRELEKGEGRGL